MSDPAWDPSDPAEPLPGHALTLRRVAPLTVGGGLLAFLPMVLIAPPPPPPPEVIADRFEARLDTERYPVPLHPVKAMTRLRFSADYAEGRTFEYRCDSADEVRAVAGTDTAGDVLFRVLSIDEHRPSRDAGAPVLVCDGTQHELLALLVTIGSPQPPPVPGPLPMLLLTKTAPADEPTVLGPRTPIM